MESGWKICTDLGVLISIVRQWEVETGDEVIQLQGHSQVIGTAIWKSDGTQILSASEEEIILWDAPTGDILFRSFTGIGDVDNLRLWLTLNFAKFSPTEEQIATRHGNSILVINATSGDEIYPDLIPDPGSQIQRIGAMMVPGC